MKRTSVTYNLTPLWEPAVILPSQMVNRRLARMPEMRLVVAMFDDAVECVVRNVGARCGTRRREFLEARDWLWDDTRGWPFAFANVCDVLGLDATAVRERLETIVPDSGAGAKSRISTMQPPPHCGPPAHSMSGASGQTHRSR
ncbi:MAG: hypothetical protein ACHQ9S_19610 [Candidatus Binatia bacterium]